MIPQVSLGARASWAPFTDRDFDAVVDLLAELENAAATGHWGHLDTVTRFSTPYSSFTVITSSGVLAVVALRSWELVSVGRPS